MEFRQILYLEIIDCIYCTLSFFRQLLYSRGSIFIVGKENNNRKDKIRKKKCLLKNIVYM